MNILLFGTMLLIFLLTLVVFVNYYTFSQKHGGINPLIMFAFMLPFGLLLLLSRRGWIKTSAHILVVVLAVLTTYSVMEWGILLPQPILMYGLLVVLVGVLLGARHAIYFTVLITLLLFGIVFLENSKYIRFDTSWSTENGGYNDVASYGITLGFIVLVSWLFNREINQSLRKLSESKQELIDERNFLEIRVKERTRELEKAQTEKMLEIHRFAEFGRVSATLLHELASPITAVLLSLDQLEESKKNKYLLRAKNGLDHIEAYVKSARMQLRKEGEQKPFKVHVEINKLINLLEPHARANNLKIKLVSENPLPLLKGDKIRFSQIIANLVMNSVDSYQSVTSKNFGIKISTKAFKNRLCITVEDQGEGIPKKDLQHIFDAFYTTKPVSHGTGIGLSITKQAVEEDFKGKLSVTSNKARGTKFTIKMPYL